MTGACKKFGDWNSTKEANPWYRQARMFRDYEGQLSQEAQIVENKGPKKIFLDQTGVDIWV